MGDEKKTYSIDVTLTGRGVQYYESDKSPDEFDSLYDFVKYAEWIDGEIIETETDSFDSWEEEES